MHAALVFGPSTVSSLDGASEAPAPQDSPSRDSAPPSDRALLVVDLASTHGTFVLRADDDDGSGSGWRRLDSAIPTRLFDGDTLRLGTLLLKIMHGQTFFVLNF